MKLRFPLILLALAPGIGISAEPPITELEFSPQAVNLTSEYDSTADKARLLWLSDGTLFTAWHQGVGPDGGAWGPDGVAYVPRDVLVRVSADGGTSWSPVLNLSNTANLTDPAVFYDRIGDGTGLSNFYGDSGKPGVIAAGNDVAVIWNDAYCGDGVQGPARYDTDAGNIEVPYRCIYVARLNVTADGITIMAVDRITDATRDAMNEVIRGTGAGFAAAWQEDPAGLQLGERRGGGHGLSGARVTPGTDVWYTWISRAAFPNPLGSWQQPVSISDNFDYAGQAIVGGGASRPSLFLAGSPAYAILVYEEAKNAGPADVGKYVLFHEFSFNDPPSAEPGVVVSMPVENARRARVVAASSPGKTQGTRLLLMWRQGEGIQGAPADFMMRVGAVAPGIDLLAVPDAGFRSQDLWPAVDPNEPQNNEAALNISGARLTDASGIDPEANAMAHRAVLSGDFIYAGYTRDPASTDGNDEYRYYLRWSGDGGATWSGPSMVSQGMDASANVIEPRLLRTPATRNSGKLEDIRDANVFVVAWGTEVIPFEAQEPVRDALYVTRTMDRGLTFEPIQRLADIRTSTGQTDEQIQLRVTPDGQQLKAVWIRHDEGRSEAVFSSAVGITRTADLTVVMSAGNLHPDVGVAEQMTITVMNRGPQPATELQLDVGLSSGLSVIEAQPEAGTCELVAGVRCALDNLEPGAVTALELTVIAGRAGVSDLSVVVTAREEEPDPSDNRVEIAIEAISKANIAVAASLDKETLLVGEIFRLRLRVDNAGPQPATDLAVDIELPDSVVPMPGNECAPVGDVVRCTSPELLSGDSWSRILSFRAFGEKRTTIPISATAREVDPVVADNSTSVTLTVSEPGAFIRYGGGGCVYAPDGGNDVVLIVLVGLALFWRIREQLQHESPTSSKR